MAERVPIDRLRLPNAETAIPLFRSQTYQVGEYASVMRRSGGWGAFPPIKCDQDLLVLGGVTRVKAATLAGVTEVPVDVVQCDTDADRLLVAVEDNAEHGVRWSTKDKTTIALTAERIGVPIDQLAHAMRVGVGQIERLPITTVRRYGAGTAEKEREAFEERIYAKRAVRHAVSNRVLTEDEEALMKSITTPNRADGLLSEFLRIVRLDALPVLTKDSHRDVLAVLAALEAWVARDLHIVEAA